MANLQIHLLGGLQIRLGDGDPPHFVSSKAPALLAYLAVTRRPHRREALAGLLWGEMPDDAAANNLRQALSSLRKAAEPHLRIDRDEVAFNADAPYFLDVELFSDLLRLQRGQPPAQGIGLLRRALSLYQGEFLAGFHVRDAPDFEEWVLGQRVQLRDLALDGLESLTRLLIESGQCQEAIPVTAQLLALDPWREEAHRWRMLALARCRQTSAALAQYRSCRAILRQEFDADPSAETTALYERIRAAQNAPRHNLPGATTGFVGREEELAALAGLLAHPANRLLTLLGPGGVGKTRLALEVARSCEPLFLNGVCFVSLAPDPQAGPEQLAQALAQALNCPLAGSAPAATQVVAFLRPKEMLLVLDNLEEWLEATPWLSRLLAQAPDVKILATSRQRLDLQAERVFPLQGLPCPAPEEADPAALAAAQLFVRRAQRVQPDFALAPGDCPALARICRAVEGLPLGIELAAAWAHQLSPAEIAAAIERSFDFLATTRRDVSPRQRSLRAVFDVSWQRLTEAEQAAFMRLSVFRGGLTRAAGQAVAECSSARLSALADQSLLQRVSSERFAMHEVLRQYAHEKLSALPGAQEETQDKHCAYFTGWLGEIESALHGAEQKETLEKIQADLENVRSAWQRALAKNDRAALSNAVQPLYDFYRMRGFFREGLDVFEQASASAPAARDPLQRQLLARLGKFHALLGSYRASEPPLRQSLELSRLAGAESDAAFALRQLGATAWMLGEFEQARALLGENVEIQKRLHDAPALLQSLLGLSGACYMLGDLEGMTEADETGRRLAQAEGNRAMTAHFSTALANAAYLRGDLAASRRLLTESLATYEALADRENRALALYLLARAALAQDRATESAELARESLAIRREIENRGGIVESLCMVGRALTAQERFPEAIEAYREALALARAAQSEPVFAYVFVGLAGLAHRQREERRAALILAFAARYAGFPDTRAEAAQLRQALQARLSASELSACAERAQKMALEDAGEWAFVDK